MATIVKRKKRYSVVYVYTDENGEKRQKWETFTTNAAFHRFRPYIHRPLNSVFFFLQ